VLWGEDADRTDMLRLLATIARGLRIKGLEGYEPPSEQIAAMFADTETPDPEAGSEERRLRVMAFMEATGGG
jgi:hypothetical protein